MMCVWEIRAAETHYTIQVNFSDVNLGVNGRNELSIVDGSGTFGGDLKRKMNGIDVNPVDYTSASNVVALVLVGEPVPAQRGFSLTWQGRDSVSLTSYRAILVQSYTLMYFACSGFGQPHGFVLFC